MNRLAPDVVARIKAYPAGTSLRRIAAETGAHRDSIAAVRNDRPYGCHVAVSRPTTPELKEVPEMVPTSKSRLHRARETTAKGPPPLARATTLPDRRAADDSPIEADAGTIRAVAQRWGITFRGPVDLWAVNQAARHNGERPFKLIADAVAAPRKSRCLKCNGWFEPEHKGDRMCHRCGVWAASQVPD